MSNLYSLHMLRNAILIELGQKGTYQHKLWVIPTNFYDGGAGVPPNVLHSSSSRYLRTAVEGFPVNLEHEGRGTMTIVVIKTTYPVFLINFKRDGTEQL